MLLKEQTMVLTPGWTENLRRYNTLSPQPSAMRSSYNGAGASRSNSVASIPPSLSHVGEDFQSSSMVLGVLLQ